MKKIKVILSGIGGVGKNLTRLLGSRPDFEIVAAYTRNPELAEKDIGVIAGIHPSGFNVTLDRETALTQQADALVVATTSFLKEVADDIRAGVEHNLNVITTAEEAAYPWLTDESLTYELDQLAKTHQVSILGAGLNPGFIFDALLLTATGIAWDVQGILIRRVVDISRFSETIQRRLGIGFSHEEFTAGVNSGAITGHIGFPQSFNLAAKCLGREMTRIEKSFEPIIAERIYMNEYLSVEIGQTAGFIQRSSGLVGGEPWISAEFIAHVDPASVDLAAGDSITIEGYNSVNLVINPGCNPQLGSAAMIANCIPRIIEAKPGFITVADLAIPYARNSVRNEFMSHSNPNF